MHLHTVQQNGAAGRGALPEPRPVIDDAQSVAATADERQPRSTLVVECLDRYPVREQGPGRIEFLAAEAVAVPVSGKAGLEGQGVLGAAFRPGVADASAVQHAAEDECLLCFSARQA